MSMPKQISIARSVVGTAIAITILGLSTLPSSALSAATADHRAADSEFVVADARSYRHCHNLSKRTYCHKADRLPQNWPPNTDTPRSGKSKNQGRIDCANGSSDCTAATTAQKEFR